MSDWHRTAGARSPSGVRHQGALRTAGAGREERARDSPSPRSGWPDGFIDNRTALAETVGLRPEEACDDATLVFAVYRKLGPDGLSQIRGQFGVAIYDAKNDTLFLGRDRWGSRSVYWARHRDCLVFASEYKALLTFRDLPARPNLAAIQYVQCTMHGHPYACYLADAQVVPSGSWVRIRDEEVSTRRFWDVSIQIADRSDEAHAAAVGTRSWRPCGSRRRRNVPSGWR